MSDLRTNSHSLSCAYHAGRVNTVQSYISLLCTYPMAYVMSSLTSAEETPVVHIENLMSVSTHMEDTSIARNRKNRSGAVEYLLINPILVLTGFSGLS